MTDSILRSYYNVSSSMFVPFVAAVPSTFANLLLSGETNGFAVDATNVSTTPSYTGAPYAGYVSVVDVGTPANNLSNVALDKSNLVQSGTSPKMVPWGSSPYLRWTPHNLLLYSQAQANAAWTVSGAGLTVTDNNAVAPDGTTTAARYAHTDATSYNNSNTTGLVILSGATYTFSVYAKPDTTSWVRILMANDSAGTNSFRAFFDITSGTVGTTSSTGSWTYVSSSITTAGGGYYRISVTGTTTDATAVVFIRCANADNSVPANGNAAWFWGAQLNRGPIATSYLVTTSAARIGIPQAYDTAASRYGILAEPAATNLCLQSEDFSTTWTNNNSTETTNSTAAPDANTTADTLTASSTANAYLTQAVSGRTDDGVNTTSVYAKAGTSNFLIIADNYISAGSNTGAWFNLSAGTVGTIQASVTSASITSIGGGWYRCSITGTNSSSGDTTLRLYVCDGDNSTNVTNGNTIFLWGAQVETGAVATSYIPTLGSTVTRAIDAVSAPASTFPFSTSVGAMVMYIRTLDTPTAAPNYMTIDDGTTFNRFVMYGNGDLNGYIFVVSAQMNQIAGSNSTITDGTAFKAALAWAANDGSVVKDGGTAGTDSSVTIPSGITTWRYGSEASGTFYTNAYLYQMTYFNRRITNTEMQTKTT